MSDANGIECWLTDMDGVLVHEEHALPGAAEFLQRLADASRRFLVLTNNSIFTPRDLARPACRAAAWRCRRRTSGRRRWRRPTSSSPDRCPGVRRTSSESGLTTALYDEAGYTMTDTDPDYVVLGETRTYSFEAITKAIRLVESGARFIATNPDATGPSKEGSLPATGSVAALITRATGAEPYFVGKPNPMMSARR